MTLRHGDALSDFIFVFQTARSAACDGGVIVRRCERTTVAVIPFDYIPHQSAHLSHRRARSQAAAGQYLAPHDRHASVVSFDRSGGIWCSGRGSCLQMRIGGEE